MEGRRIIITGQNIYPRAPNTYQSVGRRPAIWMTNMEWMTIEYAQGYIRDYERYRPTRPTDPTWGG